MHTKQELSREIDIMQAYDFHMHIWWLATTMRETICSPAGIHGIIDVDEHYQPYPFINCGKAILGWGKRSVVALAAGISTY